MGHQDADAENNENTRHSRNHIYFPVPADLKGRSGCTVKANPEQTVCFLSVMSLGHTARRIQHRQTGDLKRISSISHHRDGLFIPIEIRPHVGAALFRTPDHQSLHRKDRRDPE
jgi:hypothetical protein